MTLFSNRESEAQFLDAVVRMADYFGRLADYFAYMVEREQAREKEWAERRHRRIDDRPRRRATDR